MGTPHSKSLAMFSSRNTSASGDIEYSKRYLTLHMIERSFSFKRGSSSWYITTFPRLQALSILVAKIF